MDRRRFLALTGAASLCGACPLIAAPLPVRQIVDAGPASDYAKDGVYDAFRSIGFFVIRRGSELFALSSICTHRKVTLTARPDHTFYCRRHGSIYDPNGHVTKGPAHVDLPRLSTSVDSKGHLLVQV